METYFSKRNRNKLIRQVEWFIMTNPMKSLKIAIMVSSAIMLTLIVIVAFVSYDNLSNSIIIHGKNQIIASKDKEIAKRDAEIANLKKIVPVFYAPFPKELL